MARLNTKRDRDGGSFPDCWCSQGPPRCRAAVFPKTYIHKVFKAAHPDNSMSSKAMAVVDAMLLDLGKQVAAAASDAVTKAKAKTISDRDVQLGLTQVLPASLAAAGAAAGAAALKAAGYGAKRLAGGAGQEEEEEESVESSDFETESEDEGMAGGATKGAKSPKRTSPMQHPQARPRSPPLQAAPRRRLPLKPQRRLLRRRLPRRPWL